MFPKHTFKVIDKKIITILLSNGLNGPMTSSLGALKLFHVCIPCEESFSNMRKLPCDLDLLHTFEKR